MKAKRRKRLSRPGNNFGHICFKMFLPTYCVFMLKANLDPYFHIFFPLNCISCKYGFFVKIWVPPEISQDVFVQTSPNLPDIETWLTTNLLSKIQFDWKVLEFWRVNLFSEWIGCHGNINDQNSILFYKFEVLFK